MELDGSRDLDRVVEHYVSRLRQGEHPNIEDYAQRHPELAAEIRDLFPMLSMMEGVKAGESAVESVGAEPALPRRVAAYEIVRPIGRGGMGSVHEGRGADGARVAVKVIHPHLLGEARYVARFLREAEIGSHILHDNVVRTLESGVLQAGSRGIPYLVLEYVEGQSLRDLLKEVGRVPERLCRHIGLCIARALEAFEDAGIVHRDLKPENVVITPNETVKVMDLGVARLHEAEVQLTHTGQFVGSFRYAAPEQLAGAQVDRRADLYALGVLLYELATGIHPASAREDSAAAPASAPSTLTDGVTPFFDALVATLMQPAPGDRFQTAGALREVLEQGTRSAWWRREADRPPQALFAEDAAALHGRDAELAVLDAALDAVREGACRVVLLEGEAGIGKSRLLREWLRETSRSDAATTVLLARHDPGEGGLDLFPLGTALLDHLGTEDLEEALRRHLGSQAEHAAALAQHLRGEAQTARGGGSAEGFLSVGLLRLLRSMAREGPLILCIEDLHFAGQATRSLIPFLARALVDDRVLLYVSSRPLSADDPVGEVASLGHTVRLSLAGLDTAALQAVLGDALGTGDMDPRDVRDIARKSDGNPYFLLELATARRHGQASERSETSDSSVPATLRSLIERRLAGLSDSDRELLEAAACCGYEFDPELLSQAAGTGLIAVLKRLGRMERRSGLVVAADSAYRFHHHLLQEVLYDGLHPRLREAHHAALGGVLLAGIADGDTVGEATALDLCTHLFRGGRPEAAAPYVLSASAYLRTCWEYTRSTAVLQDALAVEGLLQGEDRAEALYLAGAGTHVASDFERAEDYLAEACELTLSRGMHRLASQALRSHADLRSRVRDDAAAERLVRRAIEEARRASAPELEARAWLAFAQNALHMGRVEDAQQACEAAAEISAGMDDTWLEIQVELDTARSARARGDLVAATRHAERSATVARKAGERGAEFQILEAQGSILFRQGRFAEALAAADRSLQIGNELGLMHLHASLLTNGAVCLYELGRLDEALVRTADAMRMTVQLGQESEHGSAERRHAAILVALGQLEEARSLLQADSARVVAMRRRIDYVIWRDAVVGVLGALGRFEEGHGLLEGEEATHEPAHLSDRVEGPQSLLLECAGRHGEAWTLLEPLLAARESAGSGHGQIALRAGRVARRLGKLDAARAALEDALAWGRRSGCVRVEVPARVQLATLPGGDVLAARVELEQKEQGLPRFEALDAYVALWEHTREDALLERARALLALLRDGAAPGDRDAMLERVDLYRRVATA